VHLLNISDYALPGYFAESYTQATLIEDWHGNYNNQANRADAKNSELTNAELDANFININEELIALAAQQS
jgi:hypothetical protein